MMQHHPHHGRHHLRPNPAFIAFFLLESVFWAAAATCVLSALHRIASALKLKARVATLEKYGDAFTEEEREQLVHKIKKEALGCM